MARTSRGSESCPGDGPDGTGETLRRIVGSDAQAGGRRKPLAGQTSGAVRLRGRSAWESRSPGSRVIPGPSGFGETVPWRKPRVPENLTDRRFKPCDPGPPTDGHCESDRLSDTRRRRLTRGHGFRHRQRRGIPDADDAGETRLSLRKRSRYSVRLRRFRFAPEPQPTRPERVVNAFCC